jgi:ATP-dependent Clp protease ATP-binding subunit ClpA
VAVDEVQHAEPDVIQLLKTMMDPARITTPSATFPTVGVTVELLTTADATG